ncbi:iron-containing alcohol dehydrogenase family protein [Lonepinella koalarum]|uniref:iron-containing alcohol dehydrogenase family protein n=1 Tax=Lonepinella koalarum TaxID=53417 RepID=UPI0011E4B486|nr:iron-containing alcohol dehydrogenase family protein [Lonepinella koalarum]TYG34282.1 iron-containing alcohol dehydrogenase family protein [Lonepinella koalarum]
MDLRSISRGIGQFICSQGALSMLNAKLTSFVNPVFLTGQKAYAAFSSFYQSEKDYPCYFYDGSCSHENIEYLANSLPIDCDCIVAIGGGKLIDTAKSVANRLNVEYITVPTLLSTCAAYTPLSIIYQSDGRIKQGEHYERAAYLCLADLDLLVHSPKSYLLDGIGDTLAKWYEANAAVANLTDDVPVFVQAALQMAKLIQQVLLNETDAAIASLTSHQVTPAFKHIVETIIGLGGMVGGLAGRKARVAGAHAIHDGMSQFPQTHQYGHGIKVAYGILVQLAAEKKMTEIEELLPFFTKYQFIHRLQDFGIHENLTEVMQQIAEIACGDGQTFRLAVPNCTVAQVVEAMQYVENL